ncbi:MAG TPA: Rieske (2Fe-2S) protein [Polyangia bacterium]|jgi:menaquinol-cytochrome c reductase iron-sulfur subunit
MPRNDDEHDERPDSRAEAEPAQTPPASGCAPAESTPAELARRKFLGRVGISLGVVGGAALSIPGLAFVVVPLFRDSPQEWRKVGKVDAFELGTTTNVVFVDASPLPWAGVTAKSAAWLRRTSAESFVAFSVNCAHLGCPVRWLEQAKLFMCPCHGGVYYQDGSVAAGPPPRPLTQYPVRVRDGDVEIHTEPIPIG